VPLLRKGTISRRGGRADPASKVAESESVTATGWITQRKTVYDGSYFWVFFYESSDVKFKCKSSVDGKAWGELQNFVTQSHPEKMYLGQGVDVKFDSSLNKLIITNPDAFYFYWARCGISNGTLTREKLNCPAADTNFNIVAPRQGYINDYVLCYHQAVHPEFNNKRGDKITFHSRDIATDGGLRPNPDPLWGTYSDENGGSVTLTREVGGADRAIYVVKDADNTLHWGYIDTTFITYPPTSLGITCTSGFNTLSGCSETELGLGTGNQHIVYIKSTGELCHRSFNGSWSSETVLVESGASYPVIACGANGRLYVFYVKAGKIWYRKFDGSSWISSKVAFAGHSYHSPTYLSSNQNVQDGKICLVWTEGTASPYEVWFCSLEDA